MIVEVVYKNKKNNKKYCDVDTSYQQDGCLIIRKASSTIYIPLQNIEYYMVRHEM